MWNTGYSTNVTYESGEYGDASCTDQYMPFVTIRYGSCSGTLYATCRDDASGSACQMYEASVDAEAFMSLAWATPAHADDGDSEDDPTCHATTENSIVWSTRADDGTMHIMIKQKVMTFDSSRQIYVGYTLSGENYEVTQGGGSVDSFVWSDCLS